MEDEKGRPTVSCWTPQTQPLFPCELCNFSSLSQKGVTIHLRKVHNIHRNPPRCKPLKHQKPRRPHTQPRLPSVTSIFNNDFLNATQVPHGITQPASLLGQHPRPAVRTVQTNEQISHKTYSNDANVGGVNPNAPPLTTMSPVTENVKFPKLNQTLPMSQYANSSQLVERCYGPLTLGYSGGASMHDSLELVKYNNLPLHLNSTSIRNMGTYSGQEYMNQSQYAASTLPKLSGPLICSSSQSWNNEFVGQSANGWNRYLLQCEMCGYQADSRYDMIAHLEVGEKRLH